MKPKKYEDGIDLNGYILDMPESIYHNTFGFTSKSELFKFSNMSNFKFLCGEKKKPTRSMQIGTALHAKILEPEKFERQFMILDGIMDRRQPEYKKAKQALGEEFVFVDSEAKDINGMHSAIMKNDKARELLSLDGWSEVSGFHVDADTKLGFRHRFDRLTKCGIGIDLKKTHSVDPYELSKTIQNFGYHWQDASYTNAYEQITGKQLKEFYFIFVEDSAPYEVAVVYLDFISREIGMNKYKQTMSEFKLFQESKHLVSNNSDAQIMTLPEWAMKEYENELLL